MFRKISKIFLKMNDKEGISAEKLFNVEFMKEFTNYESIEDFIKSSELSVKDLKHAANLESLGSEKLDEFIKNATKFESWHDMLVKATEMMMHKV